MSKSPVLAVLCLVLGVAGGFLGAILAPGPGPVVAPPGGDAAGPATGGAGNEDLSRRLGLLEERVAAFPAAGPAPAAASDAAAAPSADALPSASASDDPSLAARLERIERHLGLLPEDLSKASTADLKAHFQKNTQNSRNNGALVGVLEELLRRNLPEEEARKLRFQLGYGYRALGQHEKEEALFREMARTLPLETDDGQNAVFQLAWSRANLKDLKEAGLLMERLVNNPSSGDPLVTNCLLQAGRFAMVEGDYARARGFLERLVGPDASRVAEVQKGMITDAKRMLAEMEGK